MEEGEARALTQRDLDRAARAVAGLLDATEVVVVGSQALLVTRDDVDRSLRNSVEIDVYAADRSHWEEANPGIEASEQIAGVLGEGSEFHMAHGFYVDGVDERTATLPPNWRDHAVERIVPGDRGDVRIVAPRMADVVASKLFRGDPKDQEFASRCLRLGITHAADVLQSIRRCGVGPDLTLHAESALRSASANKNAYTAAKGGRRDELADLFLQRLKDRQGGI